MSEEIKYPLEYQGQKIKRFSWKGDYLMVGEEFGLNSPVPPVHANFEAKVCLEDGSWVDAPEEWRQKIWEWWISNMRSTIMVSALRQAGSQMLGGSG